MAEKAPTAPKAPKPPELTTGPIKIVHTIIRRVHVGVDVFAYASELGSLANPIAGKIVRRTDDPTLVDIVTFHPRSSKFPPVHPVENVRICLDDKELVAAAGGGKRWICKPVCPEDPFPYAPPAPEGTEPK